MNHNAIGAIAKQAIVLTLAINDEKHGEKWRTNSDKEDIKHIVAHLGAYQIGDTSEPHIEHALTRLSFILARLEIDRANATIATRENSESNGVTPDR